MTTLITEEIISTFGMNGTYVELPQTDEQKDELLELVKAASRNGTNIWLQSRIVNLDHYLSGGKITGALGKGDLDYFTTLYGKDVAEFICN